MQVESRSIPVAVRRAVLARDGMVCTWCASPVVTRDGGYIYRPDLLHFDHVVHWAAGGGHTVDNLVVSCARCNLSRPGPRENIRASRSVVEYRHGRYWWPEGYAPPRLVDPSRMAYLLGEYITAPRRRLVDVLRAVVRGELGATGIGEPIAIEYVPAEPQRPHRRHRA